MKKTKGQKSRDTGPLKMRLKCLIRLMKTDLKNKIIMVDIRKLRNSAEYSVRYCNAANA
jgi:hypothetical protein